MKAIIIKAVSLFTLWLTWLMLFGFLTMVLTFSFAVWDCVPLEIMSITPPAWELHLSNFIEHGGAALMAACIVGLSIVLVHRKRGTRPHLLLPLTNLIFMLSFLPPINMAIMLNRWLFPDRPYGYITAIIPLIGLILQTALWLRGQAWLLDQQAPVKRKRKAKAKISEHSRLQQSASDSIQHTDSLTSPQLTYHQQRS